MKKVLFTAKIDSHILHFHIPFLQELKNNGYEIHVASEGDSKIPYVDYKYNVEFGANPFSKNTIKSYKKLKEIVENNNFDIIHMHTAVASVVTRFAIRNNDSIRKKIYTAHGFHFLRGGPLKNWILYYPVEKYLSKYLDDLILINEEDYLLALKKFKTKNIHYVPGVGISDKFFVKSNNIPGNFDYDEQKFYLSYVAEISDRKYQSLAIDAMKIVSKVNKDIVLLLVGTGSLETKITAQINDFELVNQVKMLGYCTNVNEILDISSIAISTSKREGLAVNVMESMAKGLPIIGCNTRGVTDLIDKEGGFVISHDANELAEKIIKLFDNSELRRSMGQFNTIKSEEYKVKTIINSMMKIYDL